VAKSHIISVRFEDKLLEEVDALAYDDDRRSRSSMIAKLVRMAVDTYPKRPTQKRSTT